MIGDFRWTRGSTSDVCAIAQGNNCVLSLEEMGFGSDMKHLSGFDPKLHCCFCQKLGIILKILPNIGYLNSSMVVKYHFNKFLL